MGNETNNINASRPVFSLVSVTCPGEEQPRFVREDLVDQYVQTKCNLVPAPKTPPEKFEFSYWDNYTDPSIPAWRRAIAGAFLPVALAGSLTGCTQWEPIPTGSAPDAQAGPGDGGPEPRHADGGAPRLDAGLPRRTDGGSPQRDAGPVRADAGPGATDSGPVAEEDAGPRPTDAGSELTDAGSPRDAGFIPDGGASDGGSTISDFDGDGFADEADNCPAVYNRDQTDQDHDLMGDACDPDMDGDTFPNETDNCRLIANDQADRDSDGIGDVCDDVPYPVVLSNEHPWAPTRVFTSWSRGVLPEGKTLHHFQTCSTDGDLSEIDGALSCPNAQTTTEPFTVIDSLRAGATYFWKVHSCYNETGMDCSGYSPVLNFSTDNSLVARWQMNENGGDVVIDSGPFAINGLGNGGPAWTEGFVDGALNFNGAGQFVSVPNHPALTSMGQLTLEAWVKMPAAPPATQVIVQKYFANLTSSYIFYMRSEDPGTVAFNTHTGETGGEVSSISGVRIDDERFHHLVGTYDGTEQFFTVDNEPQGGPHLQSGLISSSGEPFCQGGPCQFQENYMTGVIDETAIYNRALSPEEIRNKYCADQVLSGSRPIPAVCIP